MNIICVSVFIVGVLGLVFGIILGYTSYQFILTDDPFIEQINKLLPQTQCGQCGYPGCWPYAKAIGTENEKINLCSPGGEEVIKKITELLDTELSFRSSYENTKTTHMLAIIDESNCIGCTKCIQICPVDAIIGSNGTIHTVMANLCIGCDLCAIPCPTQCIKMYRVITIIGDRQDMHTILVDNLHTIPIRTFLVEKDV